MIPCTFGPRYEFPDDAEESIWDKWAGGMDTENGVFAGANIVYVMAMRGDKLLGFVKGLRTKHELFVDEVLVAEEERGPQGLCTHMFRKLAEATAGRQRLQVKESNSGAIKSYKRLGYQTWYPSETGIFATQENDPGCMFMHAPRKTVLQKTEKFCQERRLADGIQLLLCAAMPIKGVTFDYVGKPAQTADEPAEEQEPQEKPDEEQDGDSSTGDVAAGDVELQETQTEQTETQTDPNMVDGMDDATGAAIENGREHNSGKIADSWGAKSVSSAVATMLNGSPPPALRHSVPDHSRSRSRVSQR